MSTPAEIEPAIGPSGPPAASPRPAETTARAPRRWASPVSAVADPEWLLFLAVLLVPAGVARVVGYPNSASFFLGTAVYVAVLRWLGWAVFGRWTTARPRYLLFAAEMFAGLAVVGAWFYLRNLLAKVWPGSYGLGELAWLFPALLALHLADLVRRGPSLLASIRGSLRTSLAALGQRLAIYVPFVVVLTTALWWISSALGVQGTDAMTHTFLARIYRTEGIDFAVPPTHLPIVYPSPFGALNATAAAVAPLSVLQAFHLQHVLLFIAALFLMTGTLAARAGRPLPLLHSLPALFLFLFPLYALYPDVLYPGTPKQAGPPLCVAICLLPLLAPTERRWAFFLTVAVVGMLTALAGALNPACAPFALVAAIVAAVVFAVRGRAFPALRPWQTLAAQVGLTLIAAGMVFACDLYYRSLLHSPTVPAADARPPTGEGERSTPPSPLFSVRQGLAGLAPVNPLGLSPVETATGLIWDRADHLRDWDERWPPRIATVGVLFLGLFALAGLLPRRSRSAAARDSLVRFLLGGLLLWLGLKYLMTFALTGLSRTNYQTMLLSVYIRFLLLRCELLLLFACLAAAAGRLYLVRGPTRIPWPLAAVGVAVCWLLPALGLAAGVEVSGFPMVPTTNRFAVTEDDLKLTAWLDDHVPPEEGTIGLAAFTFTAGPHDEEHHLYPLGGGHALGLYGRHYNFRFFLPALEGDGGAAYEQHVSEGLPLPAMAAGAVGVMGSPLAPGPVLAAAGLLPRRNRGFHAGWCLRNNIRYFYATPEGLSKNPALAIAVARGTLHPVVQFGDSVLYKVSKVQP